MHAPHIPIKVYALRHARLLQRLACLMLVLGLHAGLLFSLLETRSSAKQVRSVPHTVEAMILTETAARPASLAMPPPDEARQVTASMTPEPDLEAVTLPEPLLPLLAEHSKAKQPQVEQVSVQPHVPTVRPAQTVRSDQQSSASAVVTQSPASTTATAAPVTTAAVLLEPGLRCPLPAYPKMSRRQFEEGLVTLRFLVGEDGHVLQTEIARTSGYSRLDVAAQNALSKCRFQPAMLKGKATQSWTSIQYLWRLQ